LSELLNVRNAENQQVVFIDGGEHAQLAVYLNPQAEHLLDWFHVTMWLTVLTQTVKACRRRWGEGGSTAVTRGAKTPEHQVVSVAQQCVSGSPTPEVCRNGSEGAFRPRRTTRKLLKAVEEFSTHIERNRALFRIMRTLP
jgi:hypothetical protein